MMETEDTYWTPLKWMNLLLEIIWQQVRIAMYQQRMTLFWVIWQMKKFLNCLSKQHEYTSHYSIYNKF